jgi:ABC-type transporter Mla subunit MlaD
MADTLETAADELVRKLRSVDGEVEIAHDRLADLKEQVSTLGDQIDAAWTELASQVAELVGKAEEESAAIQRECEEATQAVGQLAGGARSARESATPALEQVQASTTNEFAEAVRQKQEPLDQLVTQAAEDTFEALGERAGEVATELEQALGEARDFLADEVVSSLEDMKGQIEERLQGLRETLVDECGSAVQAAYDDWSAKLDEVVEKVEDQGFEAAGDHAKEVVEYALDKCAEAHEKELERLMEVVQLVEEALDTVKTDVEGHRGDLAQDGKEALDEGIDQTTQALADALAALDQVKQLLASYTFVSI